jgi:hypothetical protein
MTSASPLALRESGRVLEDLVHWLIGFEETDTQSFPDPLTRPSWSRHGCRPGCTPRPKRARIAGHEEENIDVSAAETDRYLSRLEKPKRTTSLIAVRLRQIRRS